MPIVASGSKMVYMDPSQSVFNSPTMKFDWEESREAFDKINQDYADFESFNRIGEKFWKNGSTKGSLFKFSLRQSQEKLSFSTICYTDNIFEKLIEKFLNEAYLALIFLKNVKSLKMFVIEKGSSSLKETFHIKAKDSSPNNNFSSTINQRVLDKDFASIEKLHHQIDLEQNLGGIVKKYSYVACEHFGYAGENAKFKEMMIDEELSYVPLISIALPIQGEDPGGHLFSALPLPLQVKCMSGIPAHINGFFALGPDRKDLKWKTLTDTTDSNDKTVHWNQCLIKEIVPVVYIDLIKYLAESFRPNDVYTAWPCRTVVDKKWHIFLEDFYQMMSSIKFIHVQPSNEYSEVSNVWFIDPERFSSESQKNVISQFMQLANRKIAEVDSKLTNSFPKSFISWVDPPKALQIIKEYHLHFIKFTDVEQTTILDFAIKSPSDWNILATTPILRLLNGEYVALSSIRTYLVKETELINLLPMVKNNILDTSVLNGSEHLTSMFETFVSQGLFFFSLLKIRQKIDVDFVT